ncbi:MAG TPA: class I SAM-dependent methyltransferase [Methylomirabilota bacterium]|jgi:2-polyprenyl-3-methyl-5-hydroxy-6-metoxy-1,4-benzoquinol methylase|nr:class I SAM-dependent methyltransferase [Methylomirabilota bacterium]
MMHWRDLLCRRRKQLLDRVGLNRGWFRELARYYRGMTQQEFWVRYTVGRMEAAKLWAQKPRRTEADYRAFYAETDYWVLRQMYYHRNDCFHFVAAAMRQAGRSGDFCEYGCGVAPITAWLHPRFSGWRYTLVDLPSPMLEFARWRLRPAGNVEAREPGLGADLPLTRDYDVIACLEVLEHVINPLEVVQHLVSRLKPGGALFVNFVDEPGGDENLLESAAQRRDTIDYLNRELRAVSPLRVSGPDVLHGHYVKRDR